MAPKKNTPKEKSHKGLALIRSSDRTAAIQQRRQHRESSLQGATDDADLLVENENCEILSLNDDCLRKLFSYLPISDLFNVKKCCRRFSAVADEAASSLCKKKSFYFFYTYETHWNYLNCFGKFMQNVSIEPKHDELSQLSNRSKATPESTWIWLRQCTLLKTLAIRWMRLHYDPLCTETYKNLENLTIVGCHGGLSPLENIVNACKNLKSIALYDTAFIPEMFNWIGTLENIEKVTISDDKYTNFYSNTLSHRHMRAFKQLKKLESLYLDFRYRDDFVPVIAALNEIPSLTHLELHVRSFPDDFVYLLNQLENIKMCSIKYYPYLTFGRRVNLGDVFADCARNFHVTFNESFGIHGIKLKRKN